MSLWCTKTSPSPSSRVTKPAIGRGKRAYERRTRGGVGGTCGASRGARAYPTARERARRRPRSTQGMKKNTEASRSAPRAARARGARARRAARTRAWEQKVNATLERRRARTEPLGDVEPAHDALDLLPFIRALRWFGGRLLAVAVRRRGCLLHGERRQLARQRLPLPVAHRVVSIKKTVLAIKDFQHESLRFVWTALPHVWFSQVSFWRKISAKSNFPSAPQTRQIRFVPNARV